jgi:hypothetical protein
MKGNTVLVLIAAAVGIFLIVKVRQKAAEVAATPQ